MRPPAEDGTAAESRASPFSPLLEHAIELSAQWHDRTYRKGRWRDAAFPVPPEEILRVPVVAHVTAVGLLLQRAGWPDEVVAAGFLHDVIEDGNRFGETLRYNELCTVVGTEVAELVRFVTEQRVNEHGEPLPWLKRKRGYLQQISAAPEGAVGISVADKLHNLWTINETISSGIDVFVRTPERRPLSAGPKQQHWFYTEVHRIATTHRDGRVATLRDQLSGEIRRFEQLVPE